MKIPLEFPFISLLFLLVCGLCSCDQSALNPVPVIEEFSYMTCHEEANLNTRQIERKLRGAWQLSHIRGEVGHITEIETDFVLTLEKDGTASTTEQGEVVLEASWRVETGEDSEATILEYVLDNRVEEPVQRQQVFLCEGYMMLVVPSPIGNLTHFYHRPDSEPLQSRD